MTRAPGHKRKSRQMMWGWKAAAGRLGITYEEYAAHREAGDRWCCVCKRWRPFSDFQVSRSTGEPRPECRECRRSVRQAECDAFKAEYLAEHGVPYVRKTGPSTT